MPIIITKKDCLTIDISSHVLLLRSRNLIKMAFLFPSPSLLIPSRIILIIWTLKGYLESPAQSKRKKK